MKPVTLQALMRKDLPPLKFLVPGILPENAIMLLGARPQVGKTPLVHQMFLSIATGTSWSPGEPASAKGEVLLLGLERGERVLQRQLGAFLPDTTNVPPGFHVAWSWLPMDRDGFSELDDWLDHHPAVRAVGIDPWSLVKPLADKKGGMEAYWEDYADINQLRRLVRKHNIAIVLVIHTNQSEEHKDMMASFYGNTGQVAAVDVRALLKRKRGATDGTLDIGGTEIEETKYKMRFDYPRWSKRDTGEVEEHDALSKNQEKMLRALRDDCLSYTDWHKASGVAERTFADNRPKLIAMGEVRQDGDCYRAGEV